MLMLLLILLSCSVVHRGRIFSTDIIPLIFLFLFFFFLESKEEGVKKKNKTTFTLLSSKKVGHHFMVFWHFQSSLVSCVISVLPFSFLSLVANLMATGDFISFPVWSISVSAKTVWLFFPLFDIAQHCAEAQQLPDFRLRLVAKPALTNGRQVCRLEAWSSDYGLIFIML